MSFTHRSDVVRYIAYVFTHTPPSELAWKILRIQSELSVSPPHLPAWTVCSPADP